MTGGQEDGHADVDEQSALDLLGDLAADLVALALLDDDLLPVDDAVGLALADAHGAVVVVDLLEEDFHFVAHLDLGVVVELVAVEDALALEAELDDEVVAGPAADLAGDDGVGPEVVDLVAADQAFEVLGRVAQGVDEAGVDVVLEAVQIGVEVGVEGVEEVEVDHVVGGGGGPARAGTAGSKWGKTGGRAPGRAARAPGPASKRRHGSVRPQLHQALAVAGNVSPLSLSRLVYPARDASRHSDEDGLPARRRLRRSTE